MFDICQAGNDGGVMEERMTSIEISVSGLVFKLVLEIWNNYCSGSTKHFL